MMYTKLSITGGLAAALSAACTPAAAHNDTICLLEQQFSRVDTYLLDNRPQQVDLGDLDQDGYTDALILYPDANAFEIHRGMPDNSFQLLQHVPMPDEPVYQLIHDLNDDSYPDLLIAEKNTGMLSIFINNQDGTFAVGPQLDIGPDTRSMTKSDLNSDGLLDLIIAQYPFANSLDQRVIVLMGQPSLQFATPVTLLSDIPVHDTTVADFNNDLIDDIAVLEGVNPFPPNQGRVYLGNGDGTFQSPLSINHPHSSMQTLAADLNNDGNMDLVSMSRLNIRTYFFLGQGDGTFAAPIGILAGFNQTRILACDLDQDGDTDILSADIGSDNAQARSVSLLYNNDHNNNFNRRLMPNISSSAWIASADLNKDGQEDFVITDAFSNTLQVVMSQCGVCPADLNGDGELNAFDVSLLLNPAPGADIFLDYNLDGTTNYYDISAFINDFNDGCD